jgi:DNA polymerase-3 subunit gamma/tau
VPRGCLAITDVLERSAGGSKRGGGSTDSKAAAAAVAENYEVLARRSRPQLFGQVVGQDHVTQTLANAVDGGRLGHAFVFSGMRGVGKTTTARILAKALNCVEGPTSTPCNVCEHCVEITEGRSLDVFEVDAASQTGIDATRELLETVKYQPAAGRYRVYIIDEAHGLSRQAVDAFLKTLEEPPPHAKFILATTAPQKLTSTILSRCQRYDFRSVSVVEVIGALAAMVEGEGKTADDAALGILARESGGSLRDATSLLEQVLAYASGHLDPASVHAALGIPDREAMRAVVAALQARDAATVLGVVDDLVGQGADLARFAVDLLEELRHLTVLKVASGAALVDLTAPEIAALEEMAESIPADDLQRWFRILLRGQEELARTAVPRLVLEMALVEMATLAEMVPVDQLVARLESLAAGGGGQAGGAGGNGGSRASAAASGASGAAAGRSPAADRAATSAPGKGAGGGAPAGSGSGRGTGPSATAGAASRPTAPAANGNGAGPVAGVRRGETATSSGASRSPASAAGPAGQASAPAPSPEQPRWKGIVDGLQKEKASRFFRLSYSRLLEVAEGELRVGVTGQDAVTALSTPDVREDIERAIAAAFGKDLRFSPVVLEESGAVPKVADLEKEARQDPLVKLGLELLDGKIEAVMPREKRGE